MDKKQRIDKIFNILVQFEKIQDIGSGVTEETYQNYLDRLSVWYLGYGNEEAYCGLHGLYQAGANPEHETVKRMVFHKIDILDNEV